MALQKSELLQAINDKMFFEMGARMKKLGLRFFAEEIGISTPTLSRVINGSDPELSTLESICDWLKRPITDFLKTNIVE